MRNAILDGAELIFAEHGFSGGRMRDIAAQSEVNQALINYYFKSKQHLFDQVFLRRGHHITAERNRLLDELLARTDSPDVTDIVTAYLKPQWDMKYSGPRGAAFVKLQARLHAEAEEHAVRLRREVYDETVKRYIHVLDRALPHVSTRTVGLRMTFLIGTYLFMLNDLDRVSDLTDNQIGDVGKDLMLQNLITFLTQGLQAPDTAPIT